MRKKYGVLAGIIVLGIIFTLFSYAGDLVEEETLFAQGNSFYEKGEYKEAITRYQKILENRHESAPLYYNSGNAYFKSGDLGRAILNYKRALALDPRDADTIANYKFAQGMIKETVIPKRGIWAWRPLKIYSSVFTINEIMLVSSFLYVVVLILLVAAVRFQVIMRYLVTVALGIFIFLLFNITVAGYKIGNVGSDAVVISKQTGVLFGPFESATKFFTLNEGMGVKVLKKKDDWYKVRRADGKVGWLKSSEVEIV